jgi:hypothetical protein
MPYCSGKRTADKRVRDCFDRDLDYECEIVISIIDIHGLYITLEYFPAGPQIAQNIFVINMKPPIQFSVV